MTVDVVAFLELLAGDAAEAEFEGPSQAARAAGATADEQAQIDYAKRLALQVRATLEARRRREGELGALFESATTWRCSPASRWTRWSLPTAAGGCPTGSRAGSGATPGSRCCPGLG